MASPLRAQISLDSIFRTPPNKVQWGSPLATDIEVDQEGNILLLESERHRLHKLYRNASYDSIYTIGGKGIRREGFNWPRKISATNRQELYLLDYENRRMVVLNVNLKIVRQVNFLTLPQTAGLPDPDLFWPVDFAAGPSGELFLLNQEDLKVYKFNDFGEFERSFAGLDYGDGSVEDPVELSINPKNYLFVSDTTSQRVAVFDFYGTYQYEINPKLPFRYKRMVTAFHYLILFDARNIWIKNLLTQRETRIRPQIPGPLIDIALSTDYFYLLWENGIDLYPIKGEPK